ncbi:MAG: glycosyltransferase family 2 protein [Flavobacteriales bacterium]|nr:glycosyltransferase family 2 protein [Flavobacteriales bacterium]
MAQHVEAAVHSALDQSYADLEIVAVDDGSTDGTLEVLKRLELASEGRLRVIKQANAGACSARNVGLANTTGEWIQFLDADDVLFPEKIERQIALAMDQRAAVIIGSYRNRYDGSRSPETVTPLIGDPWEALIRTRMGTTSANLFRRDAIVNAGGWDASLRSSQDYELLFRILKSGATVAWDEVIGCEVLKRETGSISRTNERENWLRYLDLRCAMRDHLWQVDPKRYVDTIAIADQYLFMAIRVLSKHDRQAAFDAFQCMLPEGFIPERNVATTSSYQLAYRLFGFRNAERLAGLMSGTRTT